VQCELTRRRMLSTLGATAAGGLLGPPVARAGELPANPVAVAKCGTYGSELRPTLQTMFDQLGGLGRLVAGKTVAIKVNLVSSPWGRLGDAPVELTHWTHPAVIGATVRLLGEAGASRIRVLECCSDTTGPFAEFIGEAGWNPNDILNAAPKVEFENTNGLGSGKSYSRVWCTNGGLVFPGYDLNHSYTDCDVLVSLAKMKEHHWFGVTLTMKNIYGMTPLNIYGDTAGEDEPSIEVKGTRVSVFHSGIRAPSKSAPQEIDPNSPREAGYRIPRIVAEINSARPIHLAILDGIESMAGGEGPWYAGVRRVSPGVLVAGLNAMTTDAVAMAIMGFDPMADGGAAPFEGCDSFLRVAEDLALGTRDLNRVEVLGTPIRDASFSFRNT